MVLFKRSVLVALLFGIGLAASAFQCGRRKKEIRTLIIGGTQSAPGKWPWHVAITRRTDNVFEVICGGSIIDKSTILTAAHCLYIDHRLIATKYFLVHAAWTKPLVSDQHTRTYVPDEFIVNPNYRKDSNQNDIALIKLANEIEMSDYIQPVCICPSNQDPVGRLGSVVGFGFYKNSVMSDHLMEAKVPVVDPLDCIMSNRQTYGMRMTRSMLCAGYRNGTGPCNGDSGGGLVFESAGIWCVRGVVSFTENHPNTNNCHPNEYVVYTDVAKYIGWLWDHSDIVQTTAGL